MFFCVAALSLPHFEIHPLVDYADIVSFHCEKGSFVFFFFLRLFDEMDIPELAYLVIQKTTGMGIGGRYMSNLFKNSQLFSKVTRIFYTVTSKVEGSYVAQAGPELVHSQVWTQTLDPLSSSFQCWFLANGVWGEFSHVLFTLYLHTDQWCKCLVRYAHLPFTHPFDNGI